MKKCLLLLTLLPLLPLSASHASGMQTAASAPSAEDYLRERDKAHATLSALPIDRIEAASKPWAERLQTMMHALIGPVHVAGFAGQGDYTVDPGDVEEMPLDGLAYPATDGSRTSLTVTNWPLLHAFLKAWKENARTSSGPIAVAAALGDQDVYTGVLNNGAAVFKFADLPVTPASDGTARAIFFGQSNDSAVAAASDPDQDWAIGVAVSQGARIYIFTRPVKLTVKPGTLPACQPLFRTADKSGSEAADHAFQRCIVREMPKQPDYPRLTRQAQELVNRVAGQP